MADGFAEIMDGHGPAIGKLMAEARGLIEATLPDLSAKANPGWHAITFRHPDAGYLVGLFPFDDRVELVFEHGAALADPDGILEGGERMKQVRYVRLVPEQAVPRAAIVRLLHTALHHGALRRASRAR